MTPVRSGQISAEGRIKRRQRAHEAVLVARATKTPRPAHLTIQVEFAAATLERIHPDPPHKAIARNWPNEGQLGLADPTIPRLQTTKHLPTTRRGTRETGLWEPVVMIVALDTTVLVADPLFRSTAWKILVHASRRHGVRLCVSDIVRREAIAGYERRIGEALVGLERWETKHAHPLGIASFSARLRQEMSDAASSYEETLAATLDAVPVEVLPIPDVDHSVLVDRAVRRFLRVTATETATATH